MPHTIRILVTACCCLWFAGCTTVEGTGRLQFNVIPTSQEAALGAQAYREILSTEVPSQDGAMTAVLNRVGQRIAAQANRPDFEWEFRLIESDTINAFCLPGGKIAVYTGILPIMQNEAGMAIVMGHEVAHALARHGGERMSQNITVAVAEQMIAAGFKNAEPGMRDAVLKGFGVTTKVGVLLPFSRAHESEADHIGIMLAAKAGYDPREAVPLWERMRDSHDKRGSDFLSTHPSEDKRIAALRDLMSEAMGHYEAAPEKHGVGVALR